MEGGGGGGGAEFLSIAWPYRCDFNSMKYSVACRQSGPCQKSRLI